jgi:quinol monooxygenase YgiN
MSKVAVIAKISAQEGKRADLARALQAALDTAQGEVGTEAYVLLEDASDANLLWMYEMYTDQDALTVHMSSDAFKALGPSIMPFLAGRPELIFVKPIGGKGA